jgi:hypothetical protein
MSAQYLSKAFDPEREVDDVVTPPAPAAPPADLMAVKR